MKFRPLIAALTRPTNTRAGSALSWSHDIRRRYGFAGRRTGAAFEWLRRMSRAAAVTQVFAPRFFHQHVTQRVHRINRAQHSMILRRDRVNGAVIRTLQIERYLATPSPKVIRSREPQNVMRFSTVHRQTRRFSVDHRTFARVSRRVVTERTMAEARRRAEFAERHTVRTTELRTLAREIVTRSRRVEQMPPREPRESITVRASTPGLDVVRPHVEQTAPQAVRDLPPNRWAHEAPAEQGLNVDAITNSVMRQIDSRLSAQRERMGGL